MRYLVRSWILTLAVAGACTAPGAAPDSSTGDDGKADNGYQSSGAAREVEVDLEADVQAGSSSQAPVALGQFAMTWLRKSAKVYLESLAESETGIDRVEWRVDGRWTTLAANPSVDPAKLSHFRIRGLNAIVAEGAMLKVGDVWHPILPLDPGGTDLDACTDGLDSTDPTWYAWEPTHAGCGARTQPATITISKVPPPGAATYPEYDRLIADKRIDVLVVFGQVGHELKVADDDHAFSEVASFAAWLSANGFSEAPADLGLRYTREDGSITEVVDVYGPNEFGGLKDVAHYSNFEKGFSEHEVIVYNGHSMLGQSAFFSRPGLYQDPTKYQILLYNGCLGYEYYVDPILTGKGGWDNIDILTNVVETSVTRHFPETSLVLVQLFKGATSGGSISWQTILTKMNQIVNNEGFYGGAGIRTNRFQPTN